MKKKKKATFSIQTLGPRAFRFIARIRTEKKGKENEQKKKSLRKKE